MQLFHSQHTYPSSVRKQENTHFSNGMLGCSFLQVPALLSFFTLGIEYHHIHHLNAKVPSYRLQTCHEEGVRRHPGIWQDVYEYPWSDLLLSQGGGLVVYDQDNQCFLTTSQLHQKTSQFFSLQK